MIISYISMEKIPGKKTHLIKDSRKTACGLNYIKQSIDADRQRKEVDCNNCLKTM